MDNTPMTSGFRSRQACEPCRLVLPILSIARFSHVIYGTLDLLPVDIGERKRNALPRGRFVLFASVLISNVHIFQENNLRRAALQWELQKR